MPRFVTVGAAQLGPVARTETRREVVARLLELLKEAKGRRCDVVAFTECALTPFFPRWWMEDQAEIDQWFERQLPGPETQPLFDEAAKLGIAFHLGYAELVEQDNVLRRYNTSLLVGADGRLIGKYRKIHLLGQTQLQPPPALQHYEKRYFDRGNLGLRAWRAFGGVVGLCLSNDRRWPETFRTLGLQGAELIFLGYNTAADHPNHPELDHLTNFHSLLCQQAGAYQNGSFVVGVAKAGNEEGVNQIGRSAIIAPSGEVVTQCTTLGDELIVHRCDLDRTKLYKDQVFDFAANRRIESYGLITQTRGPVSPLEPGELIVETAPPEDAPAPALAVEAPAPAALPPEPSPAIANLFTTRYGYSPEQADELAERAQQAAELAAERKQADALPANDAPKPLPISHEPPAAPIDAIRDVLRETYGYPAEQIETIARRAVEALALQSTEAPLTALPPATAEASDEPVAASPESLSSEALAPASSEAPGSPPETSDAELPTPEPSKPAREIAADIGWLPGRFSPPSEGEPDRSAAIRHRLMRDYRYPEELARKVAALAETAWAESHQPAASREPPPTTVYVPESHPLINPSAKPRTTDIAPKPLPKTVPNLSGPEATHVYQLLTDRYGYASRPARGMAERAYSAFRRWQKVNEKPRVDPTPTPAVTVTEAELAPTIIKRSAEPAAPSLPKPERPTLTTQEPREVEVMLIPCPECQFPLKLNRTDQSLLGRKARCPKCQTKFRLPESV